MSDEQVRREFEAWAKSCHWRVDRCPHGFYRVSDTAAGLQAYPALSARIRELEATAASSEVEK
jgi:hypothetical protein